MARVPCAPPARPGPLRPRRRAPSAFSVSSGWNDWQVRGSQKIKPSCDTGVPLPFSAAAPPSVAVPCSAAPSVWCCTPSLLPVLHALCHFPLLPAPPVPVPVLPSCNKELPPPPPLLHGFHRSWSWVGPKCHGTPLPGTGAQFRMTGTERKHSMQGLGMEPTVRRGQGGSSGASRGAQCGVCGPWAPLHRHLPLQRQSRGPGAMPDHQSIVWCSQLSRVR